MNPINLLLKIGLIIDPLFFLAGKVSFTLFSQWSSLWLLFWLGNVKGPHFMNLQFMLTGATAWMRLALKCWRLRGHWRKGSDMVEVGELCKNKTEYGHLQILFDQYATENNTITIYLMLYLNNFINWLIFLETYAYFDPSNINRQVWRGASEEWELVECSKTPVWNIPQVNRFIHKRW